MPCDVHSATFPQEEKVAVDPKSTMVRKGAKLWWGALESAVSIPFSGSCRRRWEWMDDAQYLEEGGAINASGSNLSVPLELGPQRGRRP